jgi:hypothetical protein
MPKNIPSLDMDEDDERIRYPLKAILPHTRYDRVILNAVISHTEHSSNWTTATVRILLIRQSIETDQPTPGSTRFFFQAPSNNTIPNSTLGQTIEATVWHKTGLSIDCEQDATAELERVELRDLERKSVLVLSYLFEIYQPRSLRTPGIDLHPYHAQHLEPKWMTREEFEAIKSDEMVQQVRGVFLQAFDILEKRNHSAGWYKK